MQRIERTDQILIVSLVTLTLFPLLYAFRQFDDNTLTNWNWVFRQGGAPGTFLLIAGATALAFFLSRIEPGAKRYPAVLFLAAVAAILPLWNEPEVIIDAGRYFTQAKHLELYGPGSFFREWGSGISAWTDLPSIPIVYGIAFRYLGESRVVIQGITTLLFALAVVSTFRVGRTLWDAETGYLAGLLLLAMPYLLTQVPLMLVDVPTLALVTLSLDAFLCAAISGGPLRIALAAALIVLTIFAKFSAWLMLPIFPLAALVAARRGDGAAVRRALLVLGAAGAAAGALLAASHQVIGPQLGLLRGYQLPGLGRWHESTFSNFFFQIHPFVPMLAACGVAAAVRKKEFAFLVPACFVLFVLLLRVERIRYMLPLFPLLALMAAYGLHAVITDAQVRRFTALSAAGASLVLVFSAYLPFLNSTTMANLRDTGSYLDSLPGDAVKVRVLPQHQSLGSTEAAVPLLDLFTRKRIVWRQERLARPDAEKLRTAPLRFTWEQERPAWYGGQAGDDGLPVVILFSDADRVPARTAEKRFALDTGTFRYRTAAAVHIRADLARLEH